MTALLVTGTECGQPYPRAVHRHLSVTGCEPDCATCHAWNADTNSG